MEEDMTVEEVNRLREQSLEAQRWRALLAKAPKRTGSQSDPQFSTGLMSTSLKPREQKSLPNMPRTMQQSLVSGFNYVSSPIQNQHLVQIDKTDSISLVGTRFSVKSHENLPKIYKVNRSFTVYKLRWKTDHLFSQNMALLLSRKISELKPSSQDVK
jgi:hypothetical protein